MNTPIPSDPVQAYRDHVAVGHKGARLYELEHPLYETEDQYRQIMQVWHEMRSAWSRGASSPLPSPKRLPGRPRGAVAPRVKPKKEITLTVRLSLPIPLAAALDSIRGEMPLDEAVLEILRAQLGPLISTPSP